MGGDACASCVWPKAGAAAPKVKPPANAAPLFRNSLRAARFGAMYLSFADGSTRNRLLRAKVYAGTKAGAVMTAPSGHQLGQAVGPREAAWVWQHPREGLSWLRNEGSQQRGCRARRTLVSCVPSSQPKTRASRP